MTHEHEHEAAALRVALAYHRAWAAGDFEKAMTQVAPDIVCDAPAGTMPAPRPCAPSWARS